jgi:DNA mismatch endonuclease, patch repair protein
VSDSVSREQRSRNMARIRSRDTQPELIVRSTLHRLGYRFRLHKKSLPGRPDIVLSKHQTAIFVHGCFWHRHKGCKRCTTPKSNQDYWGPKLLGNKKRDTENYAALRKLGWHVLIVWECETKDSHTLINKLTGFFE